jgi:HTH-type transcriptional regulator, competence development regulator
MSRSEPDRPVLVKLWWNGLSWDNARRIAVALGQVLRSKRELRKEKLAETAKRAEISTAYLSKLEHDDVRKPSPHILHRLAGALEVPYADLMVLAGYVAASDGTQQAQLSAAMFADLTDDERAEVLSYLHWYRSRQRERTRQQS